MLIQTQEQIMETSNYKKLHSDMLNPEGLLQKVFGSFESTITHKFNGPKLSTHESLHL